MPAPSPADAVLTARAGLGGLLDETSCLVVKAISHRGAASAGAYRAWRASSSLDDANSMHHRAIPDLAEVSQREGIAEPELARMRGLARHFWASNSVKLRHLHTVLDALRQSNRPVMLLSGAALIARTPERMRSVALDCLDILVPRTAFPGACSALAHLGYSREERPLEGAMFSSPDGQCRLVIRTSPLATLSDDAFVEEIWAKSTPANLAGRAIRLPAVAHQLFCAMAQNALWNEMECFTRLLEGEALLAMFPDQIDWAEVTRLTRRYGLEAFALAYIHVLTTCTPHEIPQAMLNTLAASLDRAGINEWRYFKTRAAAGFGWRSVSRIRRDLLFRRHGRSTLVNALAGKLRRR